MKSTEGIADLHRLVTLSSNGRLSEQSYLRLLEAALSPPSHAAWRRTLRHWLLVLGALLLVSGIIYFGAYNWATLGKFQKFGLLQLILAGLFAGVMLRGMDSKEGQVLLITCAGMVGALLAVVGQVYQTGANSYLLFTTWSALITTWCLVARSNVLWSIQFALVNLSFSLWWFKDHSGASLFGTAFLALNMFLAWSWLRAGEKREWMSENVAELLIAAGLTPATILGAFTIAASEGDFADTMLSLPLALAILVSTRRKSLPSMVSFCSAVLVLGTSVLVRLFIDLEIFGLLLVGVGILFQLGTAVKFLRSILEARRQPQEGGALPHRDQQPAENLPELSDSEQRALRESPPSLPWYVQALVVGGAWLATLFVLGFCIALVSNSESALLLLGLALYAGSIGALRSEPGSEFATQSLTCVLVSGALAVVGSVDQMLSGNHLLESLTLLALCVVSLHLVRNRLNQFLAGAGLLVGFLWLCVTVLDDEFGAAVALGLSAAAILWSALHRKELLSGPYRDRLLSTHRGFAGTFLLLSTISSFGLDPGGQNLLLAITYAGCLVWFSGRLRFPPSVLMGLSAFALITWSVPAIFAAVLCYLAGYLSKDRALLHLSKPALLVSGCFYYYNLDLNLMAKSVVLLASGSVLLLLRLALRPANEEVIDAF